MTKFLEPKMVFGPPHPTLKTQQEIFEELAAKRSPENCEHSFTIFTVERGWHCKHCGEKQP